ncbi:MFS transporter [Allostreptomyces psammosilenae]|uniref:Putative MFS family arabinose efflux permease n=1 Tax=Allostreptomyces psammosilenae TaxID=1892865 RepID=A0A852ZRB0_9ACTN|nr:MFS transporter [Allostreptomyces psammosilenae]NYI04909.1 putative MFS family arabinose efflux permease [Allostreptomyces psammosilenae]
MTQDAVAASPAAPPTARLHAGSPMVRLLAVVAGLCVANLYYALPLLPAIAESLDRPADEVAPLLSLTQIGYAAGLLLLVPLGDMVDRRRLASVLVAAAGVVLLIIPFTSGPLMFVLFTVLGVVSVPAMVIVPWVADLVSDEERGRTVAAVMTGLILGTLLCRTFAGALADVTTWQVVYWVAAGFMVLCLLVLRRVPDDAAAGRDRISPTGLGYVTLIASIPAIALRRRAVVERCVYGALGFGAFSLFWTGLPLFLAEEPFSYGPGAIGLFGLLGAAGAVGAGLAGRLADRNLQAVTTVCAFLIVGLCFLGLGTGLDGLAAIIVATLLLDLAIQGAHITNQSVIYQGAPLVRSRITTAYMTSYFAGGAIGSALATAMWSGGGWRAVCLLGAGFAALALLVFVVRAAVGRMVAGRGGGQGAGGVG